MSIHNESQYLTRSIESILDQTYGNFEFIIVDDGSTDLSKNIVLSFKDKRIQLLINKSRQGLSRSLNKAIDKSNGIYIARMDGDDISEPNRFEIQLEIMERNLDVAVCGTWIRSLSGDIISEWKPPIDSNRIKSYLVFENAISHPTAMIRKKCLAEKNIKYPVEFGYAQDYALWVSLSKYYPLANIDKKLLTYRLNTNGNTEKYNRFQRKYVNNIRLSQLEELGILPSNKEFSLFCDFCDWRFKSNKEFIVKIEKFLCRMIDKNNRVEYCNKASFCEEISDRWFELCRSSSINGLWSYNTYSNSMLQIDNQISSVKKLKFIAKCFLNR